MKGKFTFLGTGGSMGIPVIGCRCSVCQSSSPFNKRFRSSGLVSMGINKLLIDAGPDFRMQALIHQIVHLDGVLFTHSHYDHTAGLDELRSFLVHDMSAIPCLLSRETAEDIERRFYYVFESHYMKFNPKITFEYLEEERGVVHFQGCEIRYLTFEQAGTKVNGFIFGDLAYISDIKHYPEHIFEDLKDIKRLVLSALRYTPSYMHLSVDEAVEFSKKCNAQNTYLTHISHDLEHEKLNAYLPSNIQLAYDGLELEFDY